MADGKRKTKGLRKPLIFEAVFAEQEQEGIWDEVDKYLQSINFFQ